jgi:hypothetical protein
MGRFEVPEVREDPGFLIGRQPAVLQTADEVPEARAGRVGPVRRRGFGRQDGVEGLDETRDVAVTEPGEDELPARALAESHRLLPSDRGGRYERKGEERERKETSQAVPYVHRSATLERK